MAIPTTCLSCRSKPCESTPKGTLDLCPYGVVFFHLQDEVVRNEPGSPLRHLAANLRHEINPVLAFIIQEAVDLDPTLSTRRIDVTTSAGRILAGTVILDEVIQMITGVHDFHPIPAGSGGQRASQSLRSVVSNKFAIYSLLRSAERVQGLTLEFDATQDFNLSSGVQLIEYIVSVLVDNVWKFSLPNTVVVARSTHRGEGLVDLEIVNRSDPLPEELDLFGFGSQASTSHKGFGYGLYWTKLLVDRYNDRVTGDGGPESEVTHAEKILTSSSADQTFRVSNVRVDTT